MKKVMMGAVALLFFSIALTPAMAQEVVNNDGFETGDYVYWTHGGPSPYFGVEDFDVTGDGSKSPCFYQTTYTGYNKNIKQTIYLIAGLTYDVNADVAYENC